MHHYNLRNSLKPVTVLSHRLTFGSQELLKSRISGRFVSDRRQGGCDGKSSKRRQRTQDLSGEEHPAHPSQKQRGQEG